VQRQSREKSRAVRRHTQVRLQKWQHREVEVPLPAGSAAGAGESRSRRECRDRQSSRREEAAEQQWCSKKKR